MRFKAASYAVTFALLAFASAGPGPLGVGTLTGVVKLKGTPPNFSPQPVARDHAFCGKTQPQQALVISSAGAVRYALINLKGVASGELTPKRGVLDNRNCQFMPHLQTLPVGSTLVVKNSDPILHTTHGHLVEYLPSHGAVHPQGQGEGAAHHHGDEEVEDPHRRLKHQESLFNVALPFKAQELEVRLKKPGLIHLMCEAGHGWMSGYIHVSDTPYAGVTDQEGRFRLEGVPAGEHELTVWHEYLGLLVQKVKVLSGRETPVMLEYSPPSHAH
ncbi:MAG: hypothetical protein HY652_11170 [Acidobacteria bacterium]|nr:hypothetical protein [Acidobacteriota bacterium]